MVKSCSYRAIRGYTILAAVLEEVAFFRVEGVNPDRELVTSLRPAMLTIPQAKLFFVSSAYGKNGILYENYRDYYGKDIDDILVWKATSLEMNPTLSQSMINRELEKDPTSARAEYLSEFRDDLETFLTLQAIDAVVVEGRTMLEPVTAEKYLAFCDPSGGRQDAMTLAIGHRKDNKSVLDRLEVAFPPFNPREVVAKFAGILGDYYISKVEGDKYSGEWVTQAFRDFGVTYNPTAKPKSELYLTLEPMVLAREIELLDNKQLVTELRQLERRTGTSGRDTVDHPARLHDDAANCVAGLANILKSSRRGLDKIVWI